MPATVTLMAPVVARFVTVTELTSGRSTLTTVDSVLLFTTASPVVTIIAAAAKLEAEPAPPLPAARSMAEDPALPTKVVSDTQKLTSAADTGPIRTRLEAVTGCPKPAPPEVATVTLTAPVGARLVRITEDTPVGPFILKKRVNVPAGARAPLVATMDRPAYIPPVILIDTLDSAVQRVPWPEETPTRPRGDEDWPIAKFMPETVTLQEPEVGALDLETELVLGESKVANLVKVLDCTGRTTTDTTSEGK